jgi:phosphoribosylanthranilate isomerase
MLASGKHDEEVLALAVDLGCGLCEEPRMSLLVKICGISTQETLDVALDHGADMIGFVFFPKSPRHITLDQAQALGQAASGRARKVALTVDADDATLAAIINALKPDLLQLHGHETPERMHAIKRRFGLPLMRAVGVASKADLEGLLPLAEAADSILFDAKAPKDAAHPGGNGLSFDWSLLAGVRLDPPFMLSGGLDASSVAEAVALSHAGGVDVSSGVESAPGLKDPAKIAAFIRAARLIKNTES